MSELLESEYEDQDQQALDEVKAAARQEGFEVVIADDSTLLLDLDNAAAIKRYLATLEIVRDRFGFEEVDRWMSKSGEGHLHVVLRTKDQAVGYGWSIRYALEQVLGSDPKRGCLALHQRTKGTTEASILFKPTKRSQIKP